MNKILVVAPHPDDETLGCGGAILRHVSEGDQVYWLIVTSMYEEQGFAASKIEARKSEIEQVADRYQFSETYSCGFAATKLDELARKQLVEKIAQVFTEVEPNTVYLPYRLDAHSDHTVVFDVVASCTKSFRYPYLKRVRAYETLSETEFGIRPENSGFHPNLFIDISKYLQTKLDILSLYEGELGEHPFPRSIETVRAQATLRGSVAGCTAAEAFMTLREII